MTPEQLTKIKTLREAGTHIKVISAEVGVPYTSVQRALNPPGKKPKAGKEDRSYRKLINSELLETIKQLLEQGHTQREIARHLGLSKSTIYAALNKKLSYSEK